MDRKERIADLVRAMDECAEDFCRRSGGSYVEFDSQYKGDESPDCLQYRRAYLVYPSFAVEFKYTAHAPLGVVNSILECMIHVDKSRMGLAVPLALLLDYCDLGTPTPLCIPGILDPEGMRAAFAMIGDVLEACLPTVSDMLGDGEARRRILSAYYGELSALYNAEIDESNAEDYRNDGFYAYFTLRFCSAAFINYLKGDTMTAVRQLGRSKKKLGYEKRVLALWSADGEAGAVCPDSVRRGAKVYGKSGVAGGDKREFAAMFLSWLFLTALFSIPYVGLFFLRLAIESRGTVYLMGPMYKLPDCFFAAFLTAILASYFTRHRVYRLLFPKHYEQYSAADQVNNGKGADRLIKGFLHVIVVCSLAGTILFAGWGIRFREDGFVDNTDYFLPFGTHYEYADIERVYYKPDRVNAFGDTLDYPSYVLKLKNGEEIDLYEYDDIENYEGALLDFLAEQGVLVERNRDGSE